MSAKYLFLTAQSAIAMDVVNGGPSDWRNPAITSWNFLRFACSVVGKMTHISQMVVEWWFTTVESNKSA